MDENDESIDYKNVHFEGPTIEEDKKSECCEHISCDNETEIDTLFITKLQPFDLAFVDGFDKDIGVRYYENKLQEPCIVYTMSNIIIIFKLETSIYSNIVGHEMKIMDIQIDKNYKIMISWDIESVFIWDLQNDEKVEPVLLRIIHEAFGCRINVLTAGLSYCGKYLLIASEKVFASVPNPNDDEEEEITVENYILQFWEWSFGSDICDDSINLPTNYGAVINIRFSCNKNEERFFAITFPRIVGFGTVQYHKQKINLYYPKCSILRKINETCYLENSSLVLSCTKKGDLIIWNDNPVCENYGIDDKEDHIDKCLYEKCFYKLLSLSEFDLNDIKNFNNYIVITDTSGETRFYDYKLLLLYIWRNNEDYPKSILSVCSGSAISKNLSATAAENFPRDLSLEHNIFLVQNFFIVNSVGEAFLCDVQGSVSKKLAFSASYRVYTDSFYTKPWLVICLEHGIVQVVNYNSKVIMAQYDIHKNCADEIRSPISYCSISIEENYIGVCLRNGYIWMLDPFTCQPTHKLLIKVKNAVTNMMFGPNNICAISDIKYSVNILKYENGEWNSLIKYRYHIDSVLNIFFFNQNDESYMVTISADRFYIKYLINKSEEFSVIIQKRLEQKPKITAANIYNAQMLGIDIDGDIIITANDLYKIVLYNAYTADKLYTFLGPIFDSPIHKIMHIPATKDDPLSYYIVVSKKTLGVILIPIDGNPYKNSGVLAHHSNIYRIKISCDKTYIILFGEGDSGGYFWSLNRAVVNKNYQCGGEELAPFCRLLPGGKNGWLFKEMQDYFFYFQIISNSLDSSDKTQVSEYIRISEIPDFMRALGFFPSEFEIKDLIYEVTRTKYAWQQGPKLIDFFNLVKLYINHKPLDGYNIDDMINSIKVVGATAARFIVLDNAEINLTKQHLLNILTNKGECIPKIQAMKYLLELLKPEGGSPSKPCEVEVTDEDIIEQFENLGDITLNAVDFCQKLLGLNAMRDPNDNSILLTTDESLDPELIYPEIGNRSRITAVQDISSDDDDNNDDNIKLK